MSEPLESTISDKSISSAEASHVKTLASPERAQGLTGSEADSGLSFLESFASYDHDTSSWRTSQRSLFEEWIPYSEGWPESGMTRSGTAYRLENSEPTISDGAFSSLPTQTAREGRDWSRVEVLASLDRGDGVAKRICNLRIGELDPCLIVGEHPSYAEERMGFPIGYTDLNESETPLSLKSQNGSESK